MFKNPANARFIIAAPKCFIKLPSKSTTADFKVLFQHTHNDQSRCFSWMNKFWTILNNQPVIKGILI